jgi:glycosyltransferase involved in cell wall biosynthesis
VACSGETARRSRQILFIGRFDLHTGGDTIIDAFRTVVERIPQAQFRFVGPDRGIPRGDGRNRTIRDFTEARIPGSLVVRTR